MIGLDPAASQLVAVQSRYPAAAFYRLPDGTRVLVVPAVPVAPGYNLATVTLRIVVPVGFPQIRLDCFYTEAHLTLASGIQPQNSGVQMLGGDQLRWFSWHPSAWDAERDDLDHFVRFCESRLRTVI